MTNFGGLDATFQALADPSRRAIIDQLIRAPASVTEIAEPLEISLPTALQHVEVLEHCGIVRTEKVGRVRVCYLDANGLNGAEHWIAARRALWRKRLDRLGEYLARGDPQKPRASKRRKKA